MPLSSSAAALLITMLGPVLVPDAPPEPRPGVTPPGMVYDEATDRYVPIIGWQPEQVSGLPTAGTKLKYSRVGEKIGEVGVRH